MTNYDTLNAATNSKACTEDNLLASTYATALHACKVTLSARGPQCAQWRCCVALTAAFASCKQATQLKQKLKHTDD